MNHKPLVSVIIPSYDRPYYLKHRSIPSVLKQTYQNWELIIVGDGPPDSTIQQTSSSFNDPRIKYTEIKRPDYSQLSGQQYWHAAGAMARNQGLKEAKGEIIAPLDDDDEFFAQHLEQCVNALGNSNLDFIYGSTVVRDSETGEEKVDYFPWSEENTANIFQKRNLLYHSSVCYSAKFRHLEYPVDGSVPADYGLWLLILAAGANFGSLDEPQCIFYAHHDGVRVSTPSLPPLPEFEQHIHEIYQSKMISNKGEFCRKFETAVADYLGIPYAVSAPSGDIALLMAFRVLREYLPSKRKVILPSYTHPSTANAAIWNGLEILFCDIDTTTLCLTPETVSKHLGSDTAAIVAVHPHGNPSDVIKLKELAHQHGALLVSDAAAAFGAKLNNKNIGSFGDLEVFSFSGTKILTTGEGGMICTPQKELAELLEVSGRYGITDNYFRASLGINGKLAEIPAALGLLGLPYVDEWIANRRAITDRYRKNLSNIEMLRFQEPVNSTSIETAKDFPIIFPSPDDARRVEKILRSHRIQTRPYYRSLHRMPSFGNVAADLPETDKISDCVLCVPCFSGLRFEVVDLVSGIIEDAANL